MKNLCTKTCGLCEGNSEYYIIQKFLYYSHTYFLTFIAASCTDKLDDIQNGKNLCRPLKKYCPKSGFRKMIEYCEYTCGICQETNGETMRKSNLEKSSLKSNKSIDLNDPEFRSEDNCKL